MTLNCTFGYEYRKPPSGLVMMQHDLVRKSLAEVTSQVGRLARMKLAREPQGELDQVNVSGVRN